MGLANDIIAIAAAGVLTATACWLLVYGLITLLAGPEARVRSRIREYVTAEAQTTNPQATEAQQRARLRTALFEQFESRWAGQPYFVKRAARVREDLEKAHLSITVIELILIQVSVGLALAVMLWVVSPNWGILLAPVGFLLGMMLVRSYIRIIGRRRIKKFEDQLPDTLSILASSVRGGFSLFQALQLIAREADEPSKTEFLRVIQEISLGAPMDEALERLARRIPTEDMDILVTAINLQHQTGGNLSHVLDVVAHTVRERHRVQREIRALTAQQRFSAILLGGLPFLMAAVLFIISPTYIGQLFQPGWVLCMPIGAFVMSIVGFFVMRKMAAIDV